MSESEESDDFMNFYTDTKRGYWGINKTKQKYKIHMNEKLKKYMHYSVINR